MTEKKPLRIYIIQERENRKRWEMRRKKRYQIERDRCRAIDVLEEQEEE